jgi:hypothetical protein
LAASTFGRRIFELIAQDPHLSRHDIGVRNDGDDRRVKTDAGPPTPELFDVLGLNELPADLVDALGGDTRALPVE